MIRTQHYIWISNLIMLVSSVTCKKHNAYWPYFEMKLFRDIRIPFIFWISFLDVGVFIWITSSYFSGLASIPHAFK